MATTASKDTKVMVDSRVAALPCATLSVKLSMDGQAVNVDAQAGARAFKAGSFGYFAQFTAKLPATPNDSTALTVRMEYPTDAGVRAITFLAAYKEFSKGSVGFFGQYNVPKGKGMPGWNDGWHCQLQALAWGSKDSGELDAVLNCQLTIVAIGSLPEDVKAQRKAERNAKAKGENTPNTVTENTTQTATGAHGEGLTIKATKTTTTTTPSTEAVRVAMLEAKLAEMTAMLEALTAPKTTPEPATTTPEPATEPATTPEPAQ